MKNILLAKKGKRIAARLIDLSIVLLLSLFVFLSFIFPKTFNDKLFLENNEEIVELYRDSDLFIVDEKGNYTAKISFSNVKTIEDLYSIDCKYNDVEYKNISILGSMYNFYTTKYSLYGDNTQNLSLESFKSEILKVGSQDSNIYDFSDSPLSLTLIDHNKSESTIRYVIDKYSETCKSMITNSRINTLTQANQKILLDSLVLFIPVIVVVSFIFDLIIPLFSPNNETIGKHIFKLGVISKDGYTYKKYKLIIRWLCFVAFEILLGIITFGGTLLISYTTFLFTKKRRCVHDFVASSCVINAKDSLVFNNEKEESFYINRSKNKGVYHG